MELNAETRRLRESLSLAGIEFEPDDIESTDDYGTTIHAERTIFEAKGEIHEAEYAWTSDADERKKGLSLGYPAYMELDGSIVTVEEVMGVAT